MRRRVTAAPVRIIRVGGLYREQARGVTVTAEDHEIQGGQRTGRILVRAVDGNVRFPSRWFCRDADLEEIQEELPLAPIRSGGRP